MSELELIAASVAQALGLAEDGNYGWGERKYNGLCLYLSRSGLDVFNDHWQVRCRDWLLEQGYEMTVRPSGVHLLFRNDGTNAPTDSIFLNPAAEFCARAIHELMKDK